MNAIKEEVHIPLFTECNEPDDFDVFVYGKKHLEERTQDNFGKALRRYLDDVSLRSNQFARLTGFSKASVSYYLSNEREIGLDNLCAICIALRLHPKKQRHLFRLSHKILPDDTGFEGDRDTIIRSYMDSCAFDIRSTLSACNAKLIDCNLRPLALESGVLNG